ncbi:hypothetical protein GCM10010924_61430 [Rhizobium wenxiniae]|uniref:DUF6896 domain-containing protein n=1 Tax=Rhizobium wenxiniae TaxID=1737357 RepID=A0A7W9YCY9_9HYPH|nr:hypothetical protein [Rhizobium wenxiniae]MBB6166324.1 hypothetical protein [Rhizobium wenxiniae]GGG23590.1 hypothetical protein GCM10010924_61430 [Rhizobium wenxiniae]
MIDEFEKLTNEYVAEVIFCISLFSRQFRRKDVIKAWRDGVVPQAGVLPGNIRYQLHGKGCQVEFTDHDVDFDFLDWDGNYGFDSWKLWMFAKQFTERYPSLQTLESVEYNLQRCVMSGAIAAVGADNDLYALANRSSNT